MIGRSGKSAGTRGLLATTALGAMLCALGAGPALAANPQEADNLRRQIESFIADPAYPGWSIQTSGPVTAEIIDDGYEFVIPDAVAIYEQPPTQTGYSEPLRFTIALDDVHVRLVPDTVDLTLYQLDAHLGAASLLGESEPVRITLRPDEDPVFIDVGSNSLSGTWSTEIGYITVGELLLQDIVAAPSPENLDAPDASVTIDAIRASVDMAEDSPGLWSGTADVVIDEVVAREKDDVPFRLGQMTLTETFGGFNFEDYMEWVESAPWMMGETPDFATPDEEASFFKQQLLNFPTMLDEFSIGWTLTDLEAGERNEHVLISRHEFGLGMTGLAGDLSDWTIHMLFDGVTIPDAEVAPQLIPNIMNIDVDIHDLPTGLGWQALEQAVGGAEVRELDQIGPMLGSQIMQLAVQNQTTMDLDGGIDWQTGNIRLSGSVQGDPESPVMASGGLNVVFNEMQDFIEEVQATMGAEAAGPMTMIQALGQQDGDSTVYDFRITGSDILMNGQDMAPMMMMLGR